MFKYMLKSVNMLNNLAGKVKKEEFALFFVSFIAVVFIERAVLFYFSKTYLMLPAFFVKGFHLHHYFIGFGLILVAFLLYFIKKEKSVFQIVFLGTGLGLMFDETSLWFPFFDNDQYWALRNFFAILLLAIIFWTFDFKFYRKMPAENGKISFKVFSIAPLIVLMSFLFSLFYFADPVTAETIKRNSVTKKIVFTKDKIKKESQKINKLFKRIRYKGV